MSAKILVIGLGILTIISLIWVFPVEIRFSFWKDWQQTEIILEVGPSSRLTRFSFGHYYRKWLLGSLLEPLKKKEAKSDLPTAAEARSDLAEFRTKLMDLAEYAKGVLELIGNKRIKRFRRLRWVTDVGLFNAMETALAAGVCWGVKGGVLDGIQQATGKSIPEPEIWVSPNYQKAGWRMEFLVIFETGLGEMLLDGWRLSQLYRVKNARTKRRLI